MPSDDERRPRRWLLLLAAATIVLAIGGPLVGRGVFLGVDIIKTFPPWVGDTPSTFVYRHGPIDDTIDVATPNRELIRRALVADHRLPLWNPYPNGGTPLASVPNEGLFSPLGWPMLILGAGLGAAWSAIARLALAFVATRALARRLGLFELASSCAGLIYAMSGFIIAWANWPQANIAAWIPALFLTADVLRERRRVRDLIAVAAVAAAMLLEGYPPLVITTLYALGPFLLIRMVDAREPRVERPDGRRWSWRDLRPFPWLLGAGALGLALSAFQVLPFLLGLSNYDLSYRVESTHNSLPEASALTTIFPWALGNPAVPKHLLAVPNFVDGFSFVGVTAVLLAILALWYGRPAVMSRGVFRYFAVGAAGLALTLYAGLHGDRVTPDRVTPGGVIKSVLYELPLMAQVPLSRLRAPFMLFLALLGAFGVEHLVRRGERPAERRWGARFRRGCLVVVGGYLLATALDSADALSATSQQKEWVLRSALPTLVVASVAVLAIVVARRAAQRWRRVAFVVLPVLIAVEALLVTTSAYPRVPRSDYYPTNSTVRFLQSHLGSYRYAAADDMMFPSAGSHYRLRSVTGHSFSPQSWRDLIFVSSPHTFSLPTLTILGHGTKVATSPVLDQLSARYFVESPEVRVFGQHVPASEAGVESVDVAAGASTLGTVPPGPIRGVTLRVQGRTRVRGSLAYLEVEVRDERGALAGRGRRRFLGQDHTRSYDIAVPGELVPSGGGPFQVTVGLRSNGADHVSLAATESGQLSLATIRPVSDGLLLAHADAGAVVWERLTALPRIRWASSSFVEKNSDHRIIDVAIGALAPNQVMLNDIAGPAEAKPAKLAILEDSPERTRVSVDAEGAGYVVIADAIQHGWVASIDGTPVPIRSVDHALGGVRVLAGHHVVELRPKPSGWDVGIALSAFAVVLSLGLVFGAGWRTRRRSVA